MERETQNIIWITKIFNEFISGTRTNIFVRTQSTNTSSGTHKDLKSHIYNNDVFLTNMFNGSSKVDHKVEQPKKTENENIFSYSSDNRLKIHNKLATSYKKSELISICERYQAKTTGTVKDLICALESLDIVKAG